MISRRLGTTGPTVGAIGLGCMGMSEFYDHVGETEAIATVHRALELGMTLIDTSDMYGRGANEELVGRALRGRREGAIVATKGGIVRRSDDPAYRAVNGTPAYLRAACDASLVRLRVDSIDLYYLHRADPNVPIEESVGALAELVQAGKVRHIGLSEVDARDAAPRNGRCPDRGAAERVFAVHPRRRDERRTACGARARRSRWWLTRRWAADAHRTVRSTGRSRRPICAGACRASIPATSNQPHAGRRPVGDCARRRLQRRRSSPSRGCSRRAMT